MGWESPTNQQNVTGLRIVTGLIVLSLSSDALMSLVKIEKKM